MNVPDESAFILWGKLNSLLQFGLGVNQMDFIWFSSCLLSDLPLVALLNYHLYNILYKNMGFVLVESSNIKNYWSNAN